MFEDISSHDENDFTNPGPNAGGVTMFGLRQNDKLSVEEKIATLTQAYVDPFNEVFRIMEEKENEEEQIKEDYEAPEIAPKKEAELEENGVTDLI